MYIPRIGPHISLEQNIGRPILEIYESLKIYECGNWETEHYNSVLEITISFLGIHKWELDIYIGYIQGIPSIIGPLICCSLFSVIIVKRKSA